MRSVTSTLFAAVCLASLAGSAMAADIAVPMDEVRIFTFKQPVSSVYVGNPTIADITTIDAQRIFIMGKSFGQTNMIALGRDGKPISNDHVTVFGRSKGAVTLNKGAQQFSYSCTAANCAPAPVPGDASEFQKAANEAVQSHSDMLSKAAGASN